MRDPVSTLPKPRPLLGEMHDYGQSKVRLRTSVVGLVRPASAHGAGGGGGLGGGGGNERGGVSSLSSSPHHCALNMGFPLSAAEVKVRVLLHWMAMPSSDHSHVLVRRWMEESDGFVCQDRCVVFLLPTDNLMDAVLSWDL